MGCYKISNRGKDLDTVVCNLELFTFRSLFSSDSKGMSSVRLSPGLSSSQRTRREKRDKTRIFNEYISQFYLPRGSSTLNVRVYDGKGNFVLCHTELFERDWILFPDELDPDTGDMAERVGGYKIYCPYASIRDIEDVLSYLYMDCLDIPHSELTIDRVDGLLHVSVMLMQSSLSDKLRELMSSLVSSQIKQQQQRLESVAVSIQDEEKEGEEGEERDDQPLDLSRLTSREYTPIEEIDFSFLDN